MGVEKEEEVEEMVVIGESRGAIVVTCPRRMWKLRQYRWWLCWKHRSIVVPIKARPPEAREMRIEAPSAALEERISGTRLLTR